MKARKSNHSSSSFQITFLLVLTIFGWRTETAISSSNGAQAHLDCRRFETSADIQFLPEILEEVSGITDISASEIAMVQDEKGIIFIYDLKSQRITKQIPFGPDGDYEAITYDKEAFYVLESSGFLHKIEKWKEKPIITKIKLDLPTKDNEGLGFDSAFGRLLVAPKSKWKKGKATKNLRPIFAYDLNSKSMSKAPVMVLDTTEITRQNRSAAKEENGKKAKKLRFRPASLAIHPASQALFVLSATDRVLATFDREGANTGHCRLPEKLFPKPEGITFLPDKTLVISNEANGKKPTLVILRSKPQRG